MHTLGQKGPDDIFYCLVFTACLRLDNIIKLNNSHVFWGPSRNNLSAYPATVGRGARLMGSVRVATIRV
jgi:hypothetical protein